MTLKGSLYYVRIAIMNTVIFWALFSLVFIESQGPILALLLSNISVSMLMSMFCVNHDITNHQAYFQHATKYFPKDFERLY